MKHVSLQIIEQTFFCHNNYVFIIGLLLFENAWTSKRKIFY